MKKYILTIMVFALAISGCSNKNKSSFVKSTISGYSIKESADRFAAVLAPKDYKRIQDLDHTRFAKEKKMYLKPTISFSLSNPTIDSKLLDCNPTMATDLPVQIALYRELNGRVTLSYTNPEYWSLKHNIKDKNCLELIKIMALDLDKATDAILKSKKQ